MFSNKFILVITAILAIALGLLPGFPLPVFIVLALLLLAVFFKHKHDEKKNKNSLTESKSNNDSAEAKGKPTMIDGQFIPETIPLIITAWTGYEAYFEKHNLPSLLKRNFFVEYGVRLPDVVMNYDNNVERGKLAVAINEIQVAVYQVIPEMSKILMRGEELQILESNVKAIETPQGNTYWLPDEMTEKVHQLGFYTRSAIDEFYSCVSTLLVHNISEFFGIQEAKTLLDDLEKKYPELLKECYRSNTVQRITEVFQRLLQERISIRNMRLILEALVQWAPKEKDPIMLVEHVRGVLARYISNRFSTHGIIRTLVMSHEMENEIRAGIRQTSNGTFINLPPPEAEKIIRRIESSLNVNHMDARDIILMVSLDIRRFVKKLIEGTYPEMEVLSFGEISTGVELDVIGSLDK